MLPTDECRLLASYFSLLSHPTRLQFFCLLETGEKTVGQLAEAAGVPRHNASQHLRLMREIGAVQTRRVAQQVFYRLSNHQLVDGLRLLREAILEIVREGVPQAVRLGLTSRPISASEEESSPSSPDLQGHPQMAAERCKDHSGSESGVVETPALNSLGKERTL
jgi:DNA-binding transcriptional ArsR family regulator